MGDINRSGSQRQLPPFDSPGALTHSATLPGRSKTAHERFLASSDPYGRHSCRFYEVPPGGGGPVMHVRGVPR
jgi:hypothetical protein